MEDFIVISNDYLKDQPNIFEGDKVKNKRTGQVRKVKKESMIYYVQINDTHYLVGVDGKFSSDEWELL